MSLEVVKQQLNDHIKTAERRLGKIEVDISVIKDNHLAHIEKDISTLKTDLIWLKKSYWVIFGSSVGALVAGVIGLLVK